MVSRFLRPVLHWTQETLRVAAPALAASARGTLGAALGTVLGGRDVGGPEGRVQPFGQQRRHRWAGTKEFGNEQAAMAFLNEGAQYEGLVKRWNNSKYYVKPYVARKQRYDRWARRRSLAKINALLDRVHYDKAIQKQAAANSRLGPIFEGKHGAASAAAAAVEEPAARKTS